ncbi:MAG: DnaD domain protein [Firmicutes bacterium]|uniref:DnaD domain protein n=1 Tax=Candidatus Onthovivens merdipullorum TaxID=2840889 RepID=A0A9D9DIH5_9BACL|nr:DnaD domain protein [Candidatus Onthovivens merdipullorum]
MKFERANALNFYYLLLEYYKELNLTENEVIVILMISHLIEQGNEFVTNDLLALKMNLSINEIDVSLSSLFTKGYVEFLTDGEKVYTSIDKIKKITYKMFEKSLFTDEENKENEELERIREKVYERFMKEFNRSLSPIEIDRIENWINDKVDENIIIDSLLEAKKRKKLSINYIDKIIISKLKSEDREGNDIK